MAALLTSMVTLILSSKGMSHTTDYVISLNIVQNAYDPPPC